MFSDHTHRPRRPHPAVLATWLFALLTLALPPAAEAQAKPAVKAAKQPSVSRITPALWRVKGVWTNTKGPQGKRVAVPHYVYLFGSIHIGNSSMFPLPRYIEEPFRTSKYLAVELNTTDITKDVQNTIRNYTLLKKGDSLQKWLRPASYTKLSSYARAHDMKGYHAKQPWFVASQISLSRAASLGFTPQYGIDYHLIKKAKALGKPILAMESWTQQLSVFGKMSRKEQDDYLQETLKSHSVPRAKDPTLKLMWAWQGGHEQDLWRQVSQEMMRIDNSAFLDRMLYDRNERMVKAIQPWLKQPYDTFVVVGAAHMLGPKGILRQLRRQGYTIERFNPRSQQWFDAYPRGKRLGKSSHRVGH